MLQLVACKILGNCLDVSGCGRRRVAIVQSGKKSKQSFELWFLLQPHAFREFPVAHRGLQLQRACKCQQLAG